MKLFVGTLYCGENELAECTAKIQRQDYRNFEHFVYKFLPNKEAHDTLFRDFLSRPEFDLLVKIDADTVLCEDTFFSHVVELFRTHKHIRLIEFVQYDFYEMVVNMSLNCYRQGFSIVDKGHLLVDRITDIPKHERMISDYVSSVHCPNPSNYQAFHFGFHAQLKQRHVSIRNTFRAYLKTLNRKRALVLCGAIDVMLGRLNLNNNLTHADETVRRRAEMYARRSAFGLFAFIVPRYLFFRGRALAVSGKQFVMRRMFAGRTSTGVRP